MATPDDDVRLLALPWRVGRTVGRTIYAQTDPWAIFDGPLIGVMDTPALAAEVVVAHNGRLARV